MLFHDAGGDGETEAGTLLLGGEKRIKEPLLDFRRNPLPGILDLIITSVDGVPGGLPVAGSRKVTVPRFPMLSAPFWTRLISTCFICPGRRGPGRRRGVRVRV